MLDRQDQKFMDAVNSTKPWVHGEWKEIEAILAITGRYTLNGLFDACRCAGVSMSNHVITQVVLSVHHTYADEN